MRRGPRRLDATVGVVAAIAGAAGVAAEGDGLVTMACAALLGAALGLARRRPDAAAALAVAASAGMAPGGAIGVTAAVLVCANAFTIGRWASAWVAPLAGAALLAGVLAGLWVDHENSGVPAIFLVATAWVAGRAIRDRDLVAARLAERGEELEREREAYAALAVRYERARIAAELHDIVAHAISVMVVQASAGQRLAAVDPEMTAETFAAIAEAARQGEQDIGRLVSLLADDDRASGPVGLALVEELVDRAAGTGLDVTLRLEGAQEPLPEPVLDLAYRVVREGLTNALRHASGAHVGVVLRAGPQTVVVEVENGPAPRGDRLAGPGSGNGLRGLRERVGAAGGRLEAAPTAAGGWCLRAALPRLAVAAPA